MTIAVDATAAVVDEVPDRGLLLAHHPLLLRGVDTRRRQHGQGCAAAQDDPNRAGVVHRPYQCRLGFARGLRCACRGAGTDGRGGAGACRRGAGQRQVGRVRARGERRCGPRGDVRRGRRADRRLLALQLGRARAPASSSRTRAHPRRSAASASVEQVAEDRRRDDRTRSRCAVHVLAALRTAHPYEEPAFDILALAVRSAGRRPRPNRCAADAADVVGVRLSRARRAARHVVGDSGVGRGRRRGVAGGGVRRAQATRFWTSSQARAWMPT